MSSFNGFSNRLSKLDKTDFSRIFVRPLPAKIYNLFKINYKTLKHLTKVWTFENRKKN